MKEVMTMTMNKKKVLAVSLGILMAVSATAGFAAQRGRGHCMMNGQGGMKQGFMMRPSAQAPLTREAYEEMLNKFVSEKKIDEAGKAALMKRYDAAKEFFAANEAAKDAREKLCINPQGPRKPMNWQGGRGQCMMGGRHQGFHMQGPRGMKGGRHQGMMMSRGMNAPQNPMAQAFCLRNQDGTVMDRDAYGTKLDGLVESKTLSAQGKEILMKRFDAVKAYIEGAGAAGLPVGRGCFR